jgi:hypothetical protein
MNQEGSKKSLVKKSATGTVIFAACCFGLLSILGVLGFTTVLSYTNRYGDFVFFPAYSAFGTVLVYALMQWKRNVYSYVAAAATIGLMVFFSIFGIIWFVLVLGGVVLGSMIILYLHKKSKLSE